jgi:hypothetical protein
MPIKNYTTTIASEKTIGEINKSLSKSGVRKIIVDYDDDGDPIGLTFSIPSPLKGANTEMLFFALPCRWEGVLKVLHADNKLPRTKRNKEQALRICWRILKDWIDAQMAMIDAEAATITEVFLPYVITKEGETLYQKMIGSPKLLGQ